MGRTSPPPTCILGVDPGSRFTGYGLIEKRGSVLRHIESGRIAAGDAPLVTRLATIFTELGAFIDRHHIDEVAVEGVFHHKSAASALKLGHARGAAIVACTVRALPVHEYQPSQVKQAVAGSGRADKHQVQQMIRMLLKLSGDMDLDTSDALAVAVCHAHRGGADRRLAAPRKRGRPKKLGS